MSEASVLRVDDVYQATWVATGSAGPHIPRLIEPPPIEAARRERGSVYSVRQILYLMTLHSRGADRKLKRPLLVEVEQGEDLFFSVWSPHLELAGSGVTVQAAVADLTSTVILLFEGLTKDKDLLTRSAKQTLDRLTALLSP